MSAAFIFLETLPLTNGKVDPNALPRPDRARPQLNQAYVQPRDEVEQKLTEIWTKVLGIDQVGIHDNFFDLGGHSLAATRVVSQVIKKFQLELPIQLLFQAPNGCRDGRGDYGKPGEKIGGFGNRSYFG